MNIIYVDISGKVSNYNFMVCNEIQKKLSIDDKIIMLSPYDEREKEDVVTNFKNGESHSKHMFSFVPMKYKSHTFKLKRFLKSLEGLFNYLYLWIYLIFHKVDVVHMAWLPFVDYFSLEYYLLRFIRLFTNKTKFVLTIHDVYPHEIKDDGKEAFANRMKMMNCVFDNFMVHTESCKTQLIEDFEYPEEKIVVAYHPIYQPKYDVLPNKIEDTGILKIIMYGKQTPYKGVDLLVDAIYNLTEEEKKKVEVIVAGMMSDKYYESVQEKAKNLNIKWKRYFLSVEELANDINWSNIVALPYRSISQSGVLLTAMYYKRNIFTSRLPSFCETLKGYKPEWFCEPGSAEDLTRLLRDYIYGRIDMKEQDEVLRKLDTLYSWENYALKHIEIYRK